MKATNIIGFAAGLLLLAAFWIVPLWIGMNGGIR